MSNLNVGNIQTVFFHTLYDYNEMLKDTEKWMEHTIAQEYINGKYGALEDAYNAYISLPENERMTVIVGGLPPCHIHGNNIKFVIAKHKITLQNAKL